MRRNTLHALCLALVTLGLSVQADATTYLTTEQAQHSGFPQADRFEPAPVHLSSEQAKAIEEASGVRVRSADQPVWVARAGTRKLGWFIVDEVYGKHEFITYAVSLNLDGSVKLVEIMDYRETHGGQVRNPSWLEQFVGKTFGAPLKLDEDIKNISGATLSCKHLADGMKRLLAFYHLVLAEKTK